MEDKQYYVKLWLLFSKVFTASLLLPVIVAFIRRKDLNKPLKIFLLYCISTFLLNLLEQGFIWVATEYYDILKPYLAYWEIKDTAFLQILFYLKDFAFLGWFYSILFPAIQGLWIRRIAFFFMIVALVNYFLIEGYNVLGVFNPAADAIFYFILPLFYLWYLYRSFLSIPVYKNSYFWFSFGLVFINILGLFWYFAGNQIKSSDYYNLFAKISIVRNWLGIIGQILFSIGFWYAPYVKYLSPPPQVENSTESND